MQSNSKCYSDLITIEDDSAHQKLTMLEPLEFLSNSKRPATWRIPQQIKIRWLLSGSWRERTRKRNRKAYRLSSVQTQRVSKRSQASKRRHQLSSHASHREQTCAKDPSANPANHWYNSAQMLPENKRELGAVLSAPRQQFPASGRERTPPNSA